VLGVILLTPPWAGSSACSSSYQQTNYVPFWLCAPDPTLYTNFARAAAKHYSSDSYGGQVDAWEIWNEPNCGDDFMPHDPALYTTILKSVYPAIKQANPGAYVYAGGSSGCTTWPNNTTGALPSTGIAGLVNSTNPSYPAPMQWNPRDWLAVMYAKGAQGYFDALAHHPYCYSDDWQSAPDQCPSTTLNSMFPQYSNAFNVMWHTFSSPSYGWPESDGGNTFASYTGTSLREQMSAHGDGAKAIALTEFGVPTTGSDGATNFTGYLGDDPTTYTNANFQVWTDLSGQPGTRIQCTDGLGWAPAEGDVRSGLRVQLFRPGIVVTEQHQRLRTVLRHRDDEFDDRLDGQPGCGEDRWEFSCAVESVLPRMA
jgi:hypothetical protein